MTTRVPLTPQPARSCASTSPTSSTASTRSNRIRAQAEELRAEPQPGLISAAPTDDPERTLLRQANAGSYARDAAQLAA